MAKKLSAQDHKFAKIVAMTGNQTKAAKEAYGIKKDGYARKRGSTQVTKSNIKAIIEKTKQSIADQIPDALLVKVHLEGLAASKKIYKNNNESGEVEYVGTEPDFAVRHKYLDSGYKAKKVYDADSNTKLVLTKELSDEQFERIIQSAAKRIH